MNGLQGEQAADQAGTWRWIAEGPDLPGVLVYGSTREEALRAAQAPALRVLADRTEHGELPPGTVSLSYWDGAIIAAASALGASVLYTEDLSHGQTYGSVRSVNPFYSETPGDSVHQSSLHRTAGKGLAEGTRLRRGNACIIRNRARAFGSDSAGSDMKGKMVYAADQRSGAGPATSQAPSGPESDPSTPTLNRCH